MVGRTLMVPKKDLDTKRRRTQDQSYTQMPRQPPSRTWGNSPDYRAGQPAILLAKNARKDKTIRQESRHVSMEQSGPTGTIRDAPIERSSGPTIEVSDYGLHHELI